MLTGVVSYQNFLTYQNQFFFVILPQSAYKSKKLDRVKSVGNVILIARSLGNVTIMFLTIRTETAK